MIQQESPAETRVRLLTPGWTRPFSGDASTASVTRKPQAEPAHHKPHHEGRILLLALLAGLPGALVSMVILWTGDYTAKVQWTLSLFIVGGWLGFAAGVRERVIFPLQTVANLLSALREGDYSALTKAIPPG